MPKFCINNEDISNGARSLNPSISPCVCPYFFSSHSPSAPIRGWSNYSNHAIYTDVMSGTQKHSNFPHMYEDISKGKFKVNGKSVPIMHNGNVFNWSRYYQCSNTDVTYTVKARRESLNNDVYIVTLNGGSTSYSVKTKNIGIKMVGGGAAGGSGSANAFLFGMTAYNGGGGGAGAAIWFHLFIKQFADTNERTLMTFKVGKGGVIPEGELVQIWDKLGFAAGTYYAPGSTPSAATKSWVEVYMNNSTITYHFDANGAVTRSHGDDASNKAGGSPSVWKSNYGSQTNIGTVKIGNKIEDDNLILTYIAGTSGGAGGARVSKGGSCTLSAKDKDIPSIYWASSGKQDDSQLSFSYSPPDWSPDMPDPVGPGWGGCSIYGQGAYTKNVNGAPTVYSSYAAGSGGLGALLTYLRPVIGGNASMTSGTNGRDGRVDFYYG